MECEFQSLALGFFLKLPSGAYDGQRAPVLMQLVICLSYEMILVCKKGQRGLVPLLPCECPSLPCPGILPCFPWKREQLNKTGLTPQPVTDTEQKFGASCDLVWEQQDEFSYDGAGGTGQVKVPPGALSLPHEQPQKDTGEESGGNEHFPTMLELCSPWPHKHSCVLELH